MFISLTINSNAEHPNYVTINTADISSVQLMSRKVTVVMKNGIGYSEEFPSVDLAEKKYDEITIAMARESLPTEPTPAEPPEVRTCRELLAHLDLFPECGDGEIIIQINDSRYELYDHPILIEGLQTTIHDLLEDLRS